MSIVINMSDLRIEQEIVKTYGISVNPNTDEENIIISDISTDINYVKKIVRLIESNNVSGVHIYDVICDMLA